MKKKLTILCVLVVLVLGLAVNAHADGAELSVSLSSTSLSIGDKVTVSVDLNGNPGITDGKVFLGYDATVLHYTESFTKVNYNGDNVRVQEDVANNRTIITLAGLMDNMSKNGTLVTVEFEALKAADNVAITPSVSELNNEDAEDISGSLSFKSATLTVAAHTHTMTKTDGTPATCLAAGTKDTWYCSGCQKTFIDEDGKTEKTDDNVIDPIKAHEGETVADKDASCKETGTKAYYACVNGCGKKYEPNTQNEITDLTIAKSAHKTGTVVAAKDADCDSAGTVAYYECEVCGKKFATANPAADAAELTSVVDPAKPAKDHGWGAPSVSADGVITTTCEDCSQTLVVTPLASVNNANLSSKGLANYQGYDATLYFEGDPIQPDGTITISIPVPAGYDKTKLVVYRVEADGSLTEVQFTVSGEYLLVATNHFSTYIVGEKADTPTPPPGGNGGAPRTGDESNIALWVVLFVACAAVVTVVATKKLRKN